MARKKRDPDEPKPLNFDDDEKTDAPLNNGYITPADERGDDEDDQYYEEEEAMSPEEVQDRKEEDDF